MKFFRWGRSFSDEDYSFDYWIAFGRVVFSVSRCEFPSRLMRYSFDIEVISSHAGPRL